MLAFDLLFERVRDFVPNEQIDSERKIAFFVGFSEVANLGLLFWCCEYDHVEVG